MYAQEFAHPPKRFYPVPWWTWNGAMDPQVMEIQLRQMLTQGIYEFFIFAEWGLEIPFNEGIWWDRIELTLRRCRELGMKVWIYDDYTWPSGVCAGRVLRDYPATRNVVLAYDRREAKAGEELTMELRGRLLAAQSVNSRGEVRSAEVQAVAGEKGTTLSWRNVGDETRTLIVFSQVVTDEAGSPYAFGAPWTWEQKGYVNTLDAEAIGHFIDLAYQPYVDRYRKYIPETLVGFFTDEPALSHYAAGGLPSLPFTPGLLGMFRRRYGYELEERLASLVTQTGNWRKVRYDYWALVCDLFANAFTRQIREWCDRNGLLFTGHYPGEEMVAINRQYNGDYWASMKWIGIPGLDLLETTTSFEPDFPPISIYSKWQKTLQPRMFNATAKLVTSTARYAGAERVMCEAYGVDPWYRQPEDQKKLTDWMSALGVNLINDNLVPYATHGMRAYSISAKSMLTPWWRYYKRFTDYAARLSQLATGRLQADVAILYPTASSWCGDPETVEWQRMQESLLGCMDGMLREHWDWELLFEAVLDEARVDGGRIEVPNAAFAALVVPGLFALTERTAAKLVEFARQGGLVAVCGQWPTHGTAGKLEVEKALATMRNVRFFADTTAATFRTELGTYLGERLVRAFRVRGGGASSLITAVRKIEGVTLIFAANQSGETVDAEIEVLAPGAVEVWQAETGERFVPPMSGRTLSYDFAPHESLLLAVGAGGTPGLPSLAEHHPRYQKAVREIALEPRWQFSTESDNHLKLRCSVMIDPQREGLERGWQRGDGGGWAASENDCSPVAIESDLPWYWLRAEVDAQYLSAHLAVVMDCTEDVEAVWVNGRPISARVPHALYADANVAFDVTEAFRAGRNVIVAQCRPSRWHSEENGGRWTDRHYLCPVVLTGAFEAHEEGSRHVLRRPTGVQQAGSWHEQGYPHYTGIGSYSQSFTLADGDPAPNRRYWLELGNVRDTAEVVVNGQTVGVKIWHPYRLDITAHVRPGLNQVTVRVANNFGNLLVRSYSGYNTERVPAGLLERARIAVTSV